MLVQIYEISTPEEARALGGLGVDHIGVLVGDGSFPREQSVDQARLIFSSIPSSSKGLALLLSADVRLIEHIISELKPAIVHLGASSELLPSAAVQQLKKRCGALTVMRSIPVVGDESIGRGPHRGPRPARHPQQAPAIVGRSHHRRWLPRGGGARASAQEPVLYRRGGLRGDIY